VSHPLPIAEPSGTTGTTAALTATEPTTTSGGSSTAECGLEEFDILGHCYRRIDVPEIVSSRAAAAADFDGDSATDLALICEGDVEPFALCVFALNSGGSIEKADLDWLTGYTPHLGVADFNDDGKPDILVSDMYHFAVFSVEATGLVLLSELAYNSSIHDLADAWMYPATPIDLDQDGAAEVVAGSGWNGLRVWRFDDVLSQWTPVGDRLPLFGCGDLADGRVADLDGDSAPEFVAIGSHNNCDESKQPGSGWNRISVFSAANGELTPVGDFAAELPGQRLTIADFDGDEILDLLVAADTDMMAFRGLGDRTFDSPIPIPGLANFTGTGPHAADFNLDGFSEALVEQEGAYRLLMALPEPDVVPMPAYIRLVLLVADLDDDGRPDFVSRLTGPDQKIHLILTLSASPPTF
jgi:hypothetical protein